MTLQAQSVSDVADPAASPAAADAVLCHCVLLRQGDLWALGHTTVAAVAAQTRATTVCGGCRPVVEAALSRSQLPAARILRVQRLGADGVRLQLAVAEPVASAPGQHVVLQAQIAGQWVARSYTLTSPGGRLGPYEVVVRREAGGLFSGWLVEGADLNAQLRCSAPQGDVCLGADERGPVYVFAGGIGITPGLSLARTLATDGSGRRLVVDWSMRQPDDMGIARELAAIARVAPQVRLRTRITGAGGGRLQAAAVGGLAPYEPGALAFVCGPAGFSTEVCAGLAAAGWPAAAVRVERFTPRRRAEVPRVQPIVAPSFHLQPGPVRGEALAFLDQMAAELGPAAASADRRAAVEAEIAATGTYTQTAAELEYGARLAWRNATRCVGRAPWQHLVVRDLRHLQTAAEVAAALIDHIVEATQGGALQATISIFRPGAPQIRLWNTQLLRYAGYRQPDGQVIGDPINVELTARAMALGWKGAGTAFDLLPLIVQIGDGAPHLAPIPTGVALEVPLSHPTLPWFAALGLRWYALPAVSELALDLGGVVYNCAPFNGYYVGTEIGARNLGDPQRYNLCPVIAARMGLDVQAPSSLWRDRALIELNTAVLHSFAQAGVRMTDHHSVSAQFLQFERAERTEGRPVFGDWSWLVPPISGSASPLFFRSDLQNVLLKPMFAYQPPPGQRAEAPGWEGPVPPCPFASGVHSG